MDADIQAHYALGLEQERVLGRIEYVRTMELLARFLPPAPARVVDIGGGSGVYAAALAGYDVSLLDAMPLHVEQARDLGLDAVVGDARALPWEDASADGALLLGPLYHLIERSERIAALREARRVLRPGGVVCAAVISRFASTYDGLARRHLLTPGFETIADEDRRSGVHRNPDPVGMPQWFTTAYLHHPDEIATELADAGFAVEAVLAIEGVASFRDELDEWLADDRREVLLRAVRATEAEPSLLGASSHLMAVGRR
jgi:SAM-dependent methyltransferase